MTEQQHDALTRTRVEAVTDVLDDHGVAYEVVEHDATYTAAAEAGATGRLPTEVAKTVVLHRGGVYFLAVVPASDRVDLRKVREVLGAARDLRMATEHEMAVDFPQYEVGAEPPLGDMPAAEIVDRRLLEADRVLIAGGDHRHGVLLDPRDPVRITDARVADICED